MVPWGTWAGPAGLEHPKEPDTFPLPGGVAPAHQGVLGELIPEFWNAGHPF